MATAPQRELLDWTPTETAQAVIARIVALANAVADEDADAADAVVVAEAKAVIARVARRVDPPWAVQKAVDQVQRAVGQRTRSLPKPRPCPRATVVIIMNPTMKRRSSMSLGSPSRLVSPNRLAIPSQNVRRRRSVKSNRTLGLHNRSSGPPQTDYRAPQPEFRSPPPPPQHVSTPESCDPRNHSHTSTNTWSRNRLRISSRHHSPRRPAPSAGGSGSDQSGGSAKTVRCLVVSADARPRPRVVASCRNKLERDRSSGLSRFLSGHAPAIPVLRPRQDPTLPRNR